jgi:hypothetical protein
MRFISCAAFAALSVLGGRSITGGADLISQERAANRMSIESVQSLHARIEFATPDGSAPAEGLPKAGEYWKQGSDERQNQTSYDQTVVQVLSLGGKQKVLTSSRTKQGKVIRAAASMSTEAGTTVVDPFRLGLFKLDDGHWDSLDELLRRPVERVNAEEAVSEGLSLVKISTRLEGRDWEIWVDPAVNHLIRKAVQSYPLPNKAVLRMECEITGFRETAPSVYFPEGVRQRHFMGDKLVADNLVHFREVRVNQPIPAGIFRMKFPAGIWMEDRIQQVNYKIDENGERLGPSVPTQEALAAPPTKTRTATVEEPPAFTRWPLVAGAVCLAAAAGTWVIRRRRLRD